MQCFKIVGLIKTRGRDIPPRRMCAIYVRTIWYWGVREIHLEFSVYGLKKPQVNFQPTLSSQKHICILENGIFMGKFVRNRHSRVGFEQWRNKLLRLHTEQIKYLQLFLMCCRKKHTDLTYCSRFRNVFRSLCTDRSYTSKPLNSFCNAIKRFRIPVVIYSVFSKNKFIMYGF